MLYFNHYAILIVFGRILIPDNKLIKNEDVKSYLQEFTEEKKIKKEKSSEEDKKNVEVKLASIFSKDMEDIKRKSEYSCFYCDKKFKIARSLKSHQSNECGRIYYCKCGKKYPYRSSFCRHRKICQRSKTMQRLF